MLFTADIEQGEMIFALIKLKSCLLLFRMKSDRELKTNLLYAMN